MLSNFHFVATTPRELSPSVQAFCRSLEPAAEPLWLEPTPAPFANVGQCYINCHSLVESRGGEIQYGWMIWELPDIYLTAEHHAIVRTSEGRLLDPTPQATGEKLILFLPSELAWNGTPIINRYCPLRDTPAVLRICQLQSRNLELFYQGRLGSREWATNDAEAARLIRRFYEIKTKWEHERKRRRKARR